MTMPTTDPLPLAGYLVAELGSRVSVAACGSVLAQLGADVVLVESDAPGSQHGVLERAMTAAGKRSLDIGSTAEEPATVVGREPLRTLLACADVVVLSSDLDAVDRELWAAARPATQILCDLTAFGHEGPLAGVAGSEATVEALSGVAATTGRRDGPPAALGAPLLEMEAAVYAASAIVAALRVRRRHGFGQRIDVALYDVGVNALAAFLPLPFSGRIATRNGNRHPTLSPWNSYQALDGWVLICAPTGDQWVRLCAAIGRPELAADPRFATTTARMESADDIDELLAAWVAGNLVEQCVEVLGRHVIPSGPVVALGGLADEPNLRHRRMVRTATDPGTGELVALPGCPAGWGTDEAAPVIPVPDSGRAALAALRPPIDAQHVTGDPVSSTRPLDGIRVVEIGMNTVGPLAGRQLGALGADVIKIEPPQGDSNRHNAPLRADGQAYVFALLNTDKRGLVLDLRVDADRQVLWDVLRTADVLIENLKPGSLGRLGFGAQDVQAVLPHLIYCSINGFGHDTVYPGRPALDTVVQAMSGIMSATVLDGVPTKAGISVSDQLGGLFGLLGVLAALEHRERHGGAGATLDLAMQDGSAWATHRLWNGTIPAQDTTTPVATVAEVLAHPQTVARGLVIERPSADGGSWQVLGSPMRLRSTPAVVTSAMPPLGHLDPELAAEFGLGAGQVRHA